MEISNRIHRMRITAATLLHFNGMYLSAEVNSLYYILYIAGTAVKGS